MLDYWSAVSATVGGISDIGEGSQQRVLATKQTDAAQHAKRTAYFAEAEAKSKKQKEANAARTRAVDLAHTKNMQAPEIFALELAGSSRAVASDYRNFLNYHMFNIRPKEPPNKMSEVQPLANVEIPVILLGDSDNGGAEAGKRSGVIDVDVGGVPPGAEPLQYSVDLGIYGETASPKESDQGDHDFLLDKNGE